MKAQSLEVRTLKNQIAACLRLIALRFKSAILRLLKLENQLEEAMKEQMPKTRKLLSAKYCKPQAKFSELVRAKSKEQVSEWLKEFGLDCYHVNLLASELLDRAITKKISEISGNAPDVLFSDGQKIESLVFSMRHIALDLDEKEKLEELLEDLVAQDSQEDGNSY